VRRRKIERHQRWRGLICHGIGWKRSVRIHGDRGRGIGVGDRGIRGGSRGIRDGGRGIRVGSSGWTRRSMVVLGSGTPSIFAILCEVTGLMATFALVFVRTLRSFMGSFADGALERLTRIPDTARVALDIALERDVLFQRHADDSSAGGDLFETGKTLVGDIEYLAKRGKSQANPGVAGFHWKVVDVDGRNG